MASQTQLVARKRATPNIGTAPGANNRRAANVDGAAPVQHQAQIHGPPFPNQTFVITNFDEDYYWNIWNSDPNDEFVAFQDTFLSATPTRKTRWRQNPVLRQLMEQVETPQNGMVPNQTVLGHGFAARAGRSATLCQIEAIRYLPTGWLQIVWPLMRRSEVDIREEIIP
ncbi:unnamed protein product [Caenorhabditis brenneri]